MMTTRKRLDMLGVVTVLALGGDALALDGKGREGAGHGREQGEEADIQGIAFVPVDEEGAQTGHDAGHQETGELVDDGDAGVAHVRREQVGEQGGLRTEDTGVEHADGDDDGQGDEEKAAAAAFHEPERGEDGQTAEQAGHAVDHAAAVAVGQAAGDEDEGAHEQGRDHDDGQGLGALDADVLHKIADDEHGQHVEEHAVDPAGAHAQGDVAGMVAADLDDGQGLVGGLAGILAGGRTGPRPPAPR